MTRSLNPSQIKAIRQIIKDSEPILKKISEYDLFKYDITQLKNNYSKIDSILAKGLLDFETSLRKTSAQLELFDYKLLFSSEDYFNLQLGYVNIKLISDYNIQSNSKKWYILVENFTPLKSVLLQNNINQLSNNKYGYYYDFSSAYKHFIILISNILLICREDF